MQTLHLGLVTDIHAGVGRSNIKSEQAISLLDSVVSEATARSVDLLAVLGDSVNATDPEHDRHWLGMVKQSLDRCSAPAVPLFGNNELKFLSPRDVANVLGCAADTEVRRVNGWSLVFWRPSCTLSFDEGLRLDESDLASLDAALASAEYPAVICLHAPIDEHSMVGNYYFANRRELAGYENAQAARDIIEASGKVVLVLAGHVHWNAGTTIDGVHYRTLASLSDTFDATAVDAAGTWAIVELGEDGWISLEVFGREPMRWSAPMRQQETHWRRPLSGDGFHARMKALWEGRDA
ncbi:MAG: metallophosphoesterase [Alphaproteobacteria bacterium]|nr:metallophosphoesterase [Alphaproteobacteria bacterium]